MSHFAIGLRIIWTLIVIGMLSYIFVHIDEKDADIVFIVGMTTLTFPVGILVALLITAIFGIALTVFDVQFANSIPFYFVVWAIYASAGYAQWFYFLPRVRRKQRARSPRAQAKEPGAN